MAFERSRTHSPLHMRRDSLAHANGQLFSSFTAALEYSQNGVVVLQRDFTLTEQITIATQGLTLDLGGHTLVVGDPEGPADPSTPVPSLLRVEASGVKICNGRILISSGSWQGICVQSQASKVDLLLEDVDVTYRGGGYALMVLSGSVMLIDSSVGSTGSGIHLSNKTASVSMLRSQVVGVQCGISLWDGRLLLEDSNVQGRHAYGLFVKSGWVDVSFSTVSSFESQALATRAVSSDEYVAMIRVRNGSQVESEATNAMLLQGGTVNVLGSMLRSMKDSAVKMGVVVDGFDVPGDVLASTKLSLLEKSTVSSWRGDGVLRGAGELVIDESCDILVSGNAIEDEGLPAILNAPAQQGELNDAAESEVESPDDSAETAIDEPSEDAAPPDADAADKGAEAADEDAPDVDALGVEADVETSEVDEADPDALDDAVVVEQAADAVIAEAAEWDEADEPSFVDEEQDEGAELAYEDDEPDDQSFESAYGEGEQHEEAEPDAGEPYDGWDDEAEFDGDEQYEEYDQPDGSDEYEEYAEQEYDEWDDQPYEEDPDVDGQPYEYDGESDQSEPYYEQDYDGQDDQFEDVDEGFDEFDEEDESIEEEVLSETPISRITIDGVHTRLDHRRPIDFSARLTTRGGGTDQVSILFEQWSDGTDVITSDESRAPLVDSTYHYIIALRAEDGYVFPNYFDIVYKGSSVGHSVMISLDRKIAMVSWGLSVTVPRGRNLPNPLNIVRPKKDIQKRDDQFPQDNTE